MAGDVRQWLEDLDLGKYADLFAESDVDFDVLPELTDNELKELGISLGHRKKLLKAIRSLVSDPDVDAVYGVRTGQSTTQGSPGPAERRQLTVMFCDLVGSTALSQRLDAEDLREVMRAYQEAVAEAVARYDGTVAKYLGDGVLAYFGWPHAHEDQAERAICTGLDAVRAVHALRTHTGDNLAARIGIASGQVVIGDLVSDSGVDTDAVTGETPNLAARLQQIAEPGQVVVGETTRQLVGQAFPFKQLPPQHLKGFAAPVAAWLVSGQAAGKSRFEATRGQQLVPFVGRRGELSMLVDRWKIAKGGEGQVVMLSGEAGIGKSRLALALSDSISGHRHFWLRFQCTPYHANSAYYPIIRQLEHAASMDPDDSAEDKLGKLASLVARNGGADAQATPLFASLMSIPYEDRYGVDQLDPMQRKLRTHSAFVDHLLALAGKYPVLMLFEDAHWIDPSSLELLEEAVTNVANTSALLLITHRPEFTAPWLDQPHVTQLSVRRLSQLQVEEMILKAGGNDLSAQDLDHIVAHSDGVPLYIEELTHSAITVDDTAVETQIPASLQDSLNARLDRLGAAKRTAAIAAVIGREVPHELLVAVSGQTDDDLNRHIETLLASGIVQQNRRGSDMSYLFKHALVQDAAYQLLLRNQRRSIHHDVARALEKKFPGRAEAQPEVLAHHFAIGGKPERAARLWLRAGQQSVGRSAVVEAVAQSEQGLAALEKIEPSRERDSLEIDLLLCLALGSLVQHHGYYGDQTERAYLRARELLDAFADDPRHIEVLHGLCVLLGVQSRFHEYLDISRDLLNRAEAIGDREAICVGQRCMAVGYNSRGEFNDAYKAASKAVESFDPQAHRRSTQRFSHDVGVAAKLHLAIACQFLGHCQRAAALTEDALRLARELNHSNTLGLAHYWACFMRLATRKFDTAMLTARAMADIAEQSGNRGWLEYSRLMSGAAQAANEESAAEGTALLDEGLKTVRANYLRPTYLCFRAEGAFKLGQFANALEYAEAGLRLVDETGERWWEAELHRVHGEICGALGADPEEGFQRALEIARRQAAKPFELRAAISLARHWRDKGKTSDARDLLAHTYDWFTEGFDLPDLKGAKTLLGELA